MQGLQKTVQMQFRCLVQNNGSLKLASVLLVCLENVCIEAYIPHTKEIVSYF